MGVKYQGIVAMGHGKEGGNDGGRDPGTGLLIGLRTCS